MHDLRKSGNKSTVFNAWIRDGSQQVSQFVVEGNTGCKLEFKP